jgi:16S rRNA (cytosine967-C5)-methyltransferase
MKPVDEERETGSRARASSGGGGGARGRSAGSGLSVTESRAVAALILADLRAGMLLDQSFEKRSTPLDARDRRWLQELVWGTLRRRGWIDAVLGSRIKGGIARLDADVADLLRLGTYQLVAMDSVPAYAAIAQMVELTKRRHGIGASGLANAVLRRIDRERDALEPSVPSDPIDALAQRYSHPRWIIARWLERWSQQDVERLLAANNMEAPIIARPWSTTVEELADSLHGAGVATHPEPLVPDSLRLQGGVSLVELGAFKQGLMFVQDPAATLVTKYAGIEKDSVAADLCAAPGGKTLELSRRASRVVASDRNRIRVERMLVGFGRLDCSNIEVLVADARQPAITPVDAVLIDVPCTGTGTFRRHPDARWRLRVSDLAVMGALQREILRGAASCVKPGGLLVYSTCSLEPEENDEMVDAFLASHPEFVIEPPVTGTVDESALDNGRLRVLPQQHGTDGAFAVRMRKQS